LHFKCRWPTICGGCFLLALQALKLNFVDCFAALSILGMFTECSSRLFPQSCFQGIGKYGVGWDCMFLKNFLSVRWYLLVVACMQEWLLHMGLRWIPLIKLENAQVPYQPKIHQFPRYLSLMSLIHEHILNIVCTLN